MLKLRGKLAELAPLVPELEFLRFCQEVGRETESHPIPRTLDRYLLDFLGFEDSRRTANLSIGYALWDLDQKLRLSHLVAYRGVDLQAAAYPVVVKIGEGIAGEMLRRAEQGIPLAPYVAVDIERDHVVAARDILRQVFGYRGVLVLPVYIGGQPRGALKIYSSHPLNAKSVMDDNRLMTEMARISAVIALASRMSTANLRENLSSQFRALDLLNPADPPDVQMQRLRNTVSDCLEFVRSATSARSCILELGHTMIPSRHSQQTDLHLSSTDDSIKQSLSSHVGPGQSHLELSSRGDGLQFTVFDRHLVEVSAKLLSRYVEKYFALREFTVKWRQRGLLLDATNNLSSQLLKSFELDDIIDHLLRGIQQAFGFSALSFLRLEDNQLRPKRCVPETFHQLVADRALEITVLQKCRFAGNPNWTIDIDCLACRDCQGFTAIAALRRQPVHVRGLPQNGLKDLQVDPGISAAAEYVFPLIVDGNVFGVLDLYSQEETPISDDELYYVRSLGNTAALAISNRRLIDRLAAVELEQTKGEVARDVVHTLTPTVSTLANYGYLIRHALNALQEPQDATKQKRSFKAAVQALDQLNEGITQQQDIVARYEARARLTEAVDRAIELRQIIDDVKNINSLRAEQKNISIHVRYDGGSERPIWASELYMYLILWNLVQNGVKFSRGGSVTITHAYTESAVTLRVNDTGIGIPRMNRAKVWEPGFSTVAPGSTTETSGQGLAIVNDLIRRTENASIEFTSTVNRGTEFVITIAQGRKYVDNKAKQTTSS